MYSQPCGDSIATDCIRYAGVTIADGTRKLVPYVGPIKINYKNRMCITGALVMGVIALLGAIPIEDMDPVIHPAQLKLILNPENPNVAKTHVTANYQRAKV